MDPTSLLGTLSAAINRHQELKNELRSMEKRCEHLKRVHLLWISYFNKTTENSVFIDDVDNFEASFNINASEESCDKNVSHSSSDNKLNRFSQRIKRILSNKPEDSKCLRSSQTPSKGLKVLNGTFSRSKSEDETSRSLLFSPSVFLVNEISKQMCGHHGFKLEGLALDQEAKKAAKGRKSTSMSIDPSSEAIKCSRRASCHVVTSNEYFSWNPTFRRSTEITGRNEDHSRSPESANKRLNFPETLKCALMQTNAFLPVFQPQTPISSRHLSSLATLHEEMVAQWISCDDVSGTSSCRSTFSNDEPFHRTDDDFTRSNNAGEQFNPDSRSTPGQDETELSVAPRDLQAGSCLSVEGTHGVSEGIIDNPYKKDHEKSPNRKLSESNNRCRENTADSRKEEVKTPISFEISPPTHQVNSDGFDEDTPSSVKVHDDFNIKCSERRCKEAVARFSCQVISLKEQLKITKLEISFLNELLNSRMERVENSCIRKPNSFTFLREMKVLRKVFKTHVDELLKELNEQVEPVKEEQENKLNDLEKFFQNVILNGVVSPRIIIFCISRLLDLFHLKFSQIKNCLSRKDLMLQSLESSLLIEQVTNKLLHYERSCKKKRNGKKHCENQSHDASSDTTFEKLKGFQHEKEFNCIETSETLESELKKLISRADKGNCRLQPQRQDPLDAVVHKSSSNHLQQSLTDFPMKSREEFCVLHEDADSSPKITEISKEDDLSSNDHLKSSDGEFLYEFSLNDLLVGQESTEIKNNPEKNMKQLNTTNEGKRNNLSIFRPSIKKSDWVIREAKLPYFEIKSFNKDIHKTDDLRKRGMKLETKRGSIPTKLENSSCPVATSELQQDRLSLSLNISHALNKSDPVKDHTDEKEPDISDQVRHGRPDRNSFDMWTCMEGYIRSPSPEKYDRSAKRSSESSRRSSKTLLSKISPNKSPLNICKNLCLVNGQSGSFDDDGTK